LEESQKKTYETFGLNQRQIEIVAAATPKRQYYYDSPEGSRLFDLALEYCPFTLSYVAVDKKALNRMNEILTEYGSADFNRHWLLENRVEYPEEKSREELIYGIEF
jgi:type IV secretion system protein VirB4